MKYNAGAMKRRSRPSGWQARPRWRLTRGPEIAFGPGKADLLEAIRGTGSIRSAAALLGMSYPRAWSLVKEMNHLFARPLIATTAQRRLGAVLTPDGARALLLYRHIESKSLRASKSEVARLLALLRKRP